MLYTIGYEGASQAAVLQTLDLNGVEILVDIRELPLSRKPGLSKKGLALAAPDYGLRYLHMRALGTPRDIRYRRKIDHDQDSFRRGYLEYLNSQDEAMQALVRLVEKETCCLLCYEADPSLCHRRLVGERAIAMSNGRIQVEDLQTMLV